MNKRLKLNRDSNFHFVLERILELPFDTKKNLL